MSNRAAVFNKLKTDTDHSRKNLTNRIIPLDSQSYAGLPAAITKTASKQSYYTIRLLADRDRVNDAYRAYAYFRWVDDRLDEQFSRQSDRMAFIERQQMLIECGYHRPDLTAEEHLLVDLIQSNREKNSGLQSYIRNMMAVMVFDANRRGRLISQQELAGYTQHLTIGVTEALHYFIGHNNPSPHNDARYLAVAGAHITHMLRDTLEDVAAGYFNIPREFLIAHGIEPDNVQCAAYREWIESRVRLARTNFAAGRNYITQVKNSRCRLAGYAYIARFEWILDAIERAGYRLRPAYPERKRLRAALRMGWVALTDSLRFTTSA